MKTFGLTGGIGMGKSTAAGLLQEHGVSVVDTDVLARQVVQPGSAALAEIVAAFGTGYVDADGKLRRRALADLVFADAAARAKLEQITHPRITELWHQQLTSWQKAGERLAVVVIPLLFETKVADEFDASICVACSSRTQASRLTERGWRPEEIQRRCSAQLPISDKIQRANFVVWTEGLIACTAEQLAKIVIR